MRIKCPYCGERDSGEFTYRGDATPVRPDSSPGQERSEEAIDAFYDYVYLRNNVAGSMDEHWYHSAGCRAWLLIRRDTVTHDIFSVEPAADVLMARKPAT